MFDGSAKGERGEAAGLVSSSTSDIPQADKPGRPDRFVVDPHLSRLRRMRGSILTAANLVQQRLNALTGRRWRAAMLHLTYADQDQFKSNQISALMKHIREWSRRRNLPTLPYVWALERGSVNGRLHYHILIWLPAGITLPKPDKQRWWPWGHTRIEWAKNKGKTAVNYIAKYISKGNDDEVSFPPNTRIHGKGGLEAVERSKCAWWRAPSWARAVWPDWEDEPRPAKGGGWVSRVSGEWLPSPFELVGFDLGRPVIQKKSSHVF